MTGGVAFRPALSEIAERIVVDYTSGQPSQQRLMALVAYRAPAGSDLSALKAVVRQRLRETFN